MILSLTFLFSSGDPEVVTLWGETLLSSSGSAVDILGFLLAVDLDDLDERFMNGHVR